MNASIDKIRSHYIEDRVSEVDPDFLSYEEDMISLEDQKLLTELLLNNAGEEYKLPNLHNSILLYITGISNDFNLNKARSDTIGGSPPDIDIDFDAVEREKAVQWVVDHWGRDNVANIITHGTFKPKSLARSYYRVTEGNSSELTSILKMIPPPKFGKEATLQEIVDCSPELAENEEYAGFYEAAQKLENMVANFGIHAAGIVISDFPIYETIPVWKNSKADRITQLDKNEVEELGLIKFDFLAIDTLSIAKEAVRLIKKHKDTDIDIFKLEDGDTKTYELLNAGLLTGIFQMETSGKAKQLIEQIRPQNISDISDISALNRPGPGQAGLDKQYVKNMRNGKPKNIPPKVATILEDTHYTLVYQEQVMKLCSELAGFSLREADDIRRAMGKKKKEVLDSYREQFIDGCKSISGLSQDYSASLWDDLLGFADYCLAGDTSILTDYGPISIRDIVEKQLDCSVLSFDKKETLIKQKIDQWHCRGSKILYEYSFEDGSSVRCTADHKFLSESGEMVEIDKALAEKIDLQLGINNGRNNN
jgi:DNA polymerase-3 subunit alpha